MALSYRTPGIYVEEISAGPRPIQSAGTSTAGFLGVAPNPARRQQEAVAINNWTQFVKEFVGEGESGKGKKSTDLSNAVFGFFQNGGTRCFVVNVGEGEGIAGGGTQRKGIRLLEQVDEVAIVAAPGFTDAGSYEALLNHCEALKDRVAVLDCESKVDESRIDRLTKVKTAEVSREGDEKGKGKKTSGGLRPRTSPGGYGAFYAPWITIQDPLAPGKNIAVPPSGHIAGIYSRVDGVRGVHKAPANEPIRGAVNVNYRITHQEQEPLNENGVNCIRFFPREGIRVWGARTVADGASEWRYLNVRRLFCMIEESIAQGTRWVVFEPNDITLWKAIRRDVSAFLMLLWRAGALKGSTPEEAFFVKCDEETNPPEVVDAGRVVTMIGVAPVKPAEFIIFRIGQYAGGSEATEIEGAG
jgi:phage tail sheath protein FI